MFEDLEAIRVAAQMLAVRREERPQQLLDAAVDLWSEMYDVSRWPEDLEQQARALAAILTAQGSVESTVSAMNEKTIEETVERILAFVQAIENARPAVC